jgi:hypothetical protein
MRTKILVFLAVWKRPEITELCFQGIKRLQSHPDFEIDALAVVSEPEAEKLCAQYGIRSVTTPNDFLGRKKNFGLAACRGLDFDFLMEIGSDDLVLNSLLDDYKKFMHYDFFGVREMAFFDSETGYCRRWAGASTYGAGRMISRSALEKMNFKLWGNDQRRGLDGFSIVQLHRKGVKYWQVPISDKPKVMDVKSAVNLWRMDYSNGVEYDPSEFISELSEPEQQFLNACLQARKKSA